MITKNDLDKIRSSALEYWQHSNHNLKDTFIKQFENGGYLVGDNAIEKGRFAGDVVHDLPVGQTMDQNLVYLASGDMIDVGSWHLEETSPNSFRLIKYGPHTPGMDTFNFILNLEKDGESWKGVSDDVERVLKAR